MSKRSFTYVCPNCSTPLEFDYVALELPETLRGAACPLCYYPQTFYPRENRAEIRTQEITKVAFLIHSSKPEEKDLLDWFRAILKLYGVDTRIIEEDPRSVDWLQKSLDGINSTNFAISFLTKRYQYTDESGVIQGWKAPDKCYEEIAIAFSLHKDLFALVEKDVAPGNVLQTRAWCYPFEKNGRKNAPIKADREFFVALDNYVNK
jgi:DNA-directed RNA polymerase subunit RPC12/RpoP